MIMIETVAYLATGLVSVALCKAIASLIRNLARGLRQRRTASLHGFLPPAYSIPYPSQRKKIALVRTSTHLDELFARDVRHALAGEGHFFYTVKEYCVDARGESVEYKALFEPQRYDAIVVSGPTRIAALKATSLMLKSTTPLIFYGMRDEAWEESEILAPTSHITGVTISATWARSIPLFKTLHQHMKQPLCFVDPAVSIREQKRIAALFEPCTATILPLTEESALEELLQKIPHDVIITENAPLSPRAHDSIISHCKRNAIPFFAADATGIVAGATVSFGLQRVRPGALVARKLLEIIERSTPPYYIPITNLTTEGGYSMICNPLDLEKAGLSVKNSLSPTLTTYGTAIAVKLQNGRVMQARAYTASSPEGP